MGLRSSSGNCHCDGGIGADVGAGVDVSKSISDNNIHRRTKNKLVLRMQTLGDKLEEQQAPGKQAPLDVEHHAAKELMQCPKFKNEFDSRLVNEALRQKARVKREKGDKDVADLVKDIVALLVEAGLLVYVESEQQAAPEPTPKSQAKKRGRKVFSFNKASWSAISVSADAMVMVKKLNLTVEDF